MLSNYSLVSDLYYSFNSHDYEDGLPSISPSSKEIISKSSSLDLSSPASKSESGLITPSQDIPKQSSCSRGKKRDLSQESTKLQEKRIKVASSGRIYKTLTVERAKKIRYSQLFISPKTRCGKKISDLAQEILKYGWDKSKPAFRVVEMPDQYPTCLDNRRLRALQEISLINPQIKFDIEILPYNEIADDSLIDAIENRYKCLSPFDTEKAKNRTKTICKKMGIDPFSNGWVVISRMNQIDDDFVKYVYNRDGSELIGGKFGFETYPAEESPQLKRNFQMRKRAGGF